MRELKEVISQELTDRLQAEYAALPQDRKNHFEKLASGTGDVALANRQADKLAARTAVEKGASAALQKLRAGIAHDAESSTEGSLVPWVASFVEIREDSDAGRRRQWFLGRA